MVLSAEGFHQWITIYKLSEVDEANLTMTLTS